jgi:hypothetical protein
MLPANEGRISTNGLPVSDQGSQTRALGWKQFRKCKKLRSHHNTDRVAAHVLRSGVAAAIAIKPCRGFERTEFKRLAQYVTGWNRSPASVTAVVSEHEPFQLYHRALWRPLLSLLQRFVPDKSNERSTEPCARKCTVPSPLRISAFKLWTVKRRPHYTPPGAA